MNGQAYAIAKERYVNTEQNYAVNKNYCHSSGYVSVTSFIHDRDGATIGSCKYVNAFVYEEQPIRHKHDGIKLQTFQLYCLLNQKREDNS